MIVGAKGGQLELVLSTAYNIGRPIENIPYPYYEELLPGGRFAAQVETAIPVCLGDSYEGFLVIGTLPERFTKLHYLDGRQLRVRRRPKLRGRPLLRGRRRRTGRAADGVEGRAARCGRRTASPKRASRGTSIARSRWSASWPLPARLSTATCSSTWKGFIIWKGMRTSQHGHSSQIRSDHADHDHDHAEMDSNKPVPDDTKRVTAVLVCAETDGGHDACQTDQRRDRRPGGPARCR